jgi:hypothetical protein
LLEKLHWIPHTGRPDLGKQIMPHCCVAGYSFTPIKSSFLYILGFI